MENSLLDHSLCVRIRTLPVFASITSLYYTIIGYMSSKFIGTFSTTALRIDCPAPFEPSIIPPQHILRNLSYFYFLFVSHLNAYATHTHSIEAIIRRSRHPQTFEKTTVFGCLKGIAVTIRC